jgi:hypothetical protein
MKKLLTFLGLFVLFFFGARQLPADGLWCYNLKACYGTAGCTDYGSVTGCTIKCLGGGTVECPELSQE